MKQPPFHRMPKAEVQRLLDAWCETLDGQSRRFVNRWLGEQVPVEETLTVDRVREAMMFVRQSVRLVDEIPDSGALPPWLAPGRSYDFGFPSEPDYESAWRLDEFAAWNVQLLLRLWPESRVKLYENKRLRSKDGAHHTWIVAADDPRLWIDVRFAPKTVCESLWPDDERGPSIQDIDRAIRVQLEPLMAAAPPNAGPPRRATSVGARGAVLLGDADYEIFGVEVEAVGDDRYQVDVAALEHIRQDPLESRLRAAITSALGDVPGVRHVAEADREVWAVEGTTYRTALHQAVVSVLELHRAELPGTD